jgi:hypothetical protein
MCNPRRFLPCVVLGTHVRFTILQVVLTVVSVVLLAFSRYEARLAVAGFLFACAGVRMLWTLRRPRVLQPGRTGRVVLVAALSVLGLGFAKASLAGLGLSDRITNVSNQAWPILKELAAGSRPLDL